MGRVALAQGVIEVNVESKSNTEEVAPRRGVD